MVPDMVRRSEKWLRKLKSHNTPNTRALSVAKYFYLDYVLIWSYIVVLIMFGSDSDLNQTSFTSALTLAHRRQ